MIGRMKRLKGSLILLLTALIWGTAFVAQTSASDSVSAFTFNGTRAVLATVFLFCCAMIRERAIPSFSKRTLLCGLYCGIPLFVASNLQQYGIEFYPAGTAVSGRAGFLTATYVIMMAVFTMSREKRFRPVIALAVIVCMGGMYLLCLSDGFSSIYVGDVLILLCALVYTIYILFVDRFGKADAIKVSCIQFAVMASLSLLCAILFEHPSVSAVRSAWFPIIYAGIFSSGIAYTLEMVAQKYAEPVVATIVMSLEAVFAALGGWLILHERLKGRELLGCILVFAAVLLAQIPEKKKS